MVSVSGTTCAMQQATLLPVVCSAGSGGREQQLRYIVEQFDALLGEPTHEPTRHRRFSCRVPISPAHAHLWAALRWPPLSHPTPTILAIPPIPPCIYPTTHQPAHPSLPNCPATQPHMPLVHLARLCRLAFMRNGTQVSTLKPSRAIS